MWLSRNKKKLSAVISLIVLKYHLRTPIL